MSKQESGRKDEVLWKGRRWLASAIVIRSIAAIIVTVILMLFEVQFGVAYFIVLSL